MVRTQSEFGLSVSECGLPESDASDPDDAGRVRGLDDGAVGAGQGTAAAAARRVGADRGMRREVGRDGVLAP